MNSAGAIDITTDAFLGGAPLIRQPKSGYRAGIDPVLLAATCPDVPELRVLDCGAGVGTVGLCVAQRLPSTVVTMVERETVYAALAQENIRANGLAARVTLIQADLTAPLSTDPDLARRIGSFDHALANPPYYIDTDGTRAADPLKDAANAMPVQDLDHWARFMAAMLKPQGAVTIIHRVDALPLLLAALERRFGGIIIRCLHPRTGASANRVLVRATKSSKAPLIIAPPLVLHDASGAYSDAVTAVLRHGAALPLT